MRDNAFDIRRARRWPDPDRCVMLLVALGFVLRIVWVVVANRPAAVGDPVAYVFHGDQLSRGLGYNSHGVAMEQLAGVSPPGDLPPTAFYAIGYPLFLALMFRIARVFGIEGTYESYALVYGVAHALLGAATVYLVARIARRLVSPRAAVAAAALVALWPNLIGYTASANLETLYLLLLAAAVLVLLPALEGGVSTTRLIAAGAILGAAAQVRPLVALAIPAVLLAFRRRPEPWRAAMVHALLVGTTMLAVLLPWTIRNAVVMPEPVLVTTGTGDALCISRHVGATGRFEFGSPGCVHPTPGALSAEAEIERNRVNTERALRFVRDHPIDELELWFRRAWAGFRDDHESRLALEAVVAGSYTDPIWPNSPTRRGADLGADLWYYLVVVLAVVGFPRFLRDRCAGPVLIVGFAAAAAVVPILLFGDPRYKVPMLPLVALVAATPLVSLTERATAGLRALRAHGEHDPPPTGAVHSSGPR